MPQVDKRICHQLHAIVPLLDELEPQHEGSGLNVADRRRCLRVSDRVIVLLRPGNAGGGKDPDFWCASEDGEGMVIGESLQTPDVSGPVRRSSAAMRRRRPPLTRRRSRASLGALR